MPLRISRDTMHRLARLLLRSLPLLPAPEIYDVLINIKQSQGDIDNQVSDAIESIRKTSKLVSSLEDNLKDKVAKLEHLQREHQRYSQLAEMEAEKADAVIKQIDDALGRNVKKERWI